MAAKSIEEFQTNQETMNEEFGLTPETLGNDSLSQPIQGFHMSVKEYYNQLCIWISKLETVDSIHYVDDEWYVVEFFFGLKMDLMERVFRHKGISEAFRWAEIEENSGKNDADVVFDEMSNPEAGNEKSGDLVVQLEADHGKIISLYHLIEDDSMLTQPEPVFPIVGKMVEQSCAYKVFDKMPQLSFVWPFEQLNGNKGFIPLIDGVPRVFDPGSVTDEFPFLIFVPRIDIELYKVEISGLMFVPGGHSVCSMGCSSLRPIGKNCALCDFWADELTSATFQLCVPDPCSRVSSLHQTGYATRHSLEPRKINGKAIMKVFDPGGILVCCNGCDPFEHHKSFHSCKCNGKQNDYDCVFDKLNVKLAYNQAMIVITATLLVLNVIVGFTREENGSHRSINSWILIDVGILVIQEFGGPFGLVIIRKLHGILIDHGQNDMIWSFHSISRNDGAEIWCFWAIYSIVLGHTCSICPLSS